MLLNVEIIKSKMSYEKYLKEEGVKERKIKEEWIQNREKNKDELEKLIANATKEELQQMVRNLWGKIDDYRSIFTDPSC